MSRVAAATFIAPIACSLLFGHFFIFAYLFILIPTVFCAVPLFFWLEKLKRLEWWHALFSGLLITSPLIFLTNTYGLDYLIDRNNVLAVGIGTTTALIFWWIAVFRNKEYAFVSSSLPLGQLLLVPIFIFGPHFYKHLSQTQDIHHQGRVLSIQSTNPYPIRSNRCVVRVLLDNGDEVDSDFSGCEWPEEKVLNTCFHIRKRWSTLRFKVVYVVSNQCGHSPPVKLRPDSG